MVVAALVVAATTLAACSGGGDAEPRKIVQVRASLLPPTLMGLTVQAEDIDKLVKGTRRPYIDEMGLFSFRKEDLLQATLQVSRFSDDADSETEGFRRTVAGQIVGTGAELPEFRMGTRTIFLGGNARQTISVWFDGPYMMVLAARSDFEEPRGLLRSLVDLGIGGAGS